MTIEFQPIDDPYSEEVFALTKAGLFPYVDAVFGWDDEFQKQRIKDDYQREWFHWVWYENEKIGYVCFKRYDQALHVHLIVLASQHQGCGLGRKVMEAVHSIANEEQRDVTLSSFKCNTRAVELYKKLGYSIEHEEDHFLLYKLSLNGTKNQR
jgi:ribosomal protein S18 acetylase RimI-like enzyme